MENEKTYVDTTTFFVEDEPIWHELVMECFDQYGIEFSKLIRSDSVKDIEWNLNNHWGPSILILDLSSKTPQMGGQDFTGYIWAIDELGKYMERNAGTVPFVISGNLSDPVIDTLVRKGIPQDHIFDKGDWADHRADFAEKIKEVVTNLDDITMDSISQGPAGKNIDPYLIHHFELAKEEQAEAAGEGAETQPFELPMLIRTDDPDWDYHKIPDLDVLDQIGNIFTCFGTEQSIIALAGDRAVISVEASRPFASLDADAFSLPFVKADCAHKNFSEKGDQAIAAVIDVGIDVLHETFRDDSGKKTRILAIWDQTDPTGPGPKGYLKDNKTYGTLHTEEDINRYIQGGKLPPALEKKMIEGEAMHGTQVASIMAGRPVGAFPGGVAPEAKILVVITTNYRGEMKVGGRSILGYTHNQNLALRFIKQFAKEKHLPVVINISQGTCIGAHDGTSTLERAFDLITDNGVAPGIVVVKSAGNDGDKNTHAKLSMISMGRETLEWEVRTSNFHEDMIELWFSSNDEFKFTLIDPEGNKSGEITSNHSTERKTFPSGNGYYLTLNKRHQDNGDSCLSIHITFGRESPILTGIWQLRIESAQVKSSGEIHAWIECSDCLSTRFAYGVSPEVTISIPGTANHIITVGSVKAEMPYQVSRFSAYGPTRDKRSKPDLSAPGENITVPASSSPNGVLNCNGTSFAAPHVAGAVALGFSYREKQKDRVKNWRQYNQVQIHRAITQSVQNYTPQGHPIMGFGVLDIDNFLNELMKNP